MAHRVRLIKNAEFTVRLPHGDEVEQIFNSNTFLSVTRVGLLGDGYANVYLVDGSILKEVQWDSVFEPHGNIKEYLVEETGVQIPAKEAEVEVVVQEPEVVDDDDLLDKMIAAELTKDAEPEEEALKVKPTWRRR